MALSRYYQPTNFEYISQFVPKNLELMDRGLQRAQAKQDKQVGKLDDLNSMILKQNALEGQDTIVRDKIVGEVKSFSDEMANTDLTNPENFRKVNQFVQQYANDERLKKLDMGLASKAKYDKIKEDLVTKGDYATENDRVFMNEFEKYYIQPDNANSKFAIDFIGGKELIEKNAPSRPKLEEMIDSKLGSSYVQDSVDGTWKHKTTREALTDKELRGIMANNAEPFLGTTEGKQMIRRYEMRKEQDPSWTLDKQYWEEVNPVIAEKTYSRNKNEFTDISSRAVNLQKVEDNKAFALVQKGKTAGEFANFKNLESYDAEINRLKTSENPVDKYKAGQMESQREVLNENFSKNLTGKEKYVLSATAEDLRDKPALLSMLAKKIYGNNELISLKDPSKLTDFEKNNIIEKAKYYPDIVGEVLGESLNVDYKQKNKERNEYIAKGEINEARDIILSASKGSTEIKNHIVNQAKTAFNDINWNVKSTSKEGATVSESVNTIDKQSIKVINSAQGPEIFYRYKDSDGNYQTISIASKDIGKYPQETTIENYQKLSGGDEQLFSDLFESHVYANLQPIGINSSYNMKEDIIRYLPQESVEKFNKFQDLKIIRDGSSVRLIGNAEDGTKMNLKAPSVPDLIDLAITY